MGKIWEIDRGYNRLHIYSKLTSLSCFSSIKVEGLENLPKEGAVLLAPNHVAAMADPMMLMYALDAPVGFGARSDIFRNPKIAKILRWMRIVPIARERNGLQEVAKNYEIFDEIVDCLDHGMLFCLYAEGTHRPERGMMPVKKGIFHIAKIACDKLDKPVWMVPMGLDYEDFFRCQSRVAVRIGAPIDVRAEFERRQAAGMAEGDIYRELCQDLRERILALIGRLPERRHDRKLLRLLLAILSLPLYLLCAVGSILIWLPHLIIMSKMEDKAWSHTVRYVLHVFLPLFWPFAIVFERLTKFYRNLIEDFHKR